MAYPEPANEEQEVIQVNNAQRKPMILLAASGSVASMKFGNLYYCFSEWADVRAVATRASLHFFDRASLPKDAVLYTDEDEWTGWSKIGDIVLHIGLISWSLPLCLQIRSARLPVDYVTIYWCIVRAWDYNKPLFVAPAMNTYMWTNPFTELSLG